MWRSEGSACMSLSKLINTSIKIPNIYPQNGRTFNCFITSGPPYQYKTSRCKGKTVVRIPIFTKIVSIVETYFWREGGSLVVTWSTMYAFHIDWNVSDTLEGVATLTNWQFFKWAVPLSMRTGARWRVTRACHVTTSADDPDESTQKTRCFQEYSKQIKGAVFPYHSAFLDVKIGTSCQ